MSPSNERYSLMTNRPLLARRIALWQLMAILLATCAAGSSESVEPAVERTMVEVKFRVVEISTSKLRAAGFDWDAISGQESLRDRANPGEFLKALAENNLARTVAEPMIGTISGQPASLKVASRALEVTPTVLENDRIRLAYRIATQIPARDGTPTPFESASTTELKSGEAQVLSETRTLTYDTDGKKDETTICVVAEAKTVKR